MSESAEDVPFVQLLDSLEAALEHLADPTLQVEELARAGEEQARLVDRLTGRLRAELARLEHES